MLLLYPKYAFVLTITVENDDDMLLFGAKYKYLLINQVTIC